MCACWVTCLKEGQEERAGTNLARDDTPVKWQLHDYLPCEQSQQQHVELFKDFFLKDAYAM